MIQKNKQKHSENFERLEIGRVIFWTKKHHDKQGNEEDIFFFD